MGDTLRPVEVVQELTRRFMGGDAPGAYALLHPTFRIQQPDSLPHGGWHAGPDGMQEMGAQFAAHWDRTISDTHLVDGGDEVVVLTNQTWTSKATGKSANVDVMELFTFTDGLIASIHVFQQDTHRMLLTLDA